MPYVPENFEKMKEEYLQELKEQNRHISEFEEIYFLKVRLDYNAKGLGNFGPGFSGDDEYEIWYYKEKLEFQNWLLERKKDIEKEQKRKGLNTIEKIILIRLLQMFDFFPIPGQFSSKTDTAFHELIGLLVDADKSNVRKRFEEAHKILTKDDLDKQSLQKLKPQRENLKNILPIIERLDTPSLIQKIQSRIALFDKAIKSKKSK